MAKKKRKKNPSRTVARTVPRTTSRKKKRIHKGKRSKYPNELNSKEFKFVDGLFLFFLNGTRAAKYAKYKCPAVTASQLLDKPKIVAEIKCRQDALREASTEQVIATVGFLLRVATVTVTDLAVIKPDGFSMLDLDKCTREEQWALQKYERRVTKFGINQKFDLVDRVRLIELAMRLSGHLPAENQAGMPADVIRAMLDRLQNGDRDNATGIPASADTN